MEYYNIFWNTLILVTFRSVILEARPAAAMTLPQLRQHRNLEYGICKRPLAVSVCIESCMAASPSEFGNMALFASNLVKYLSKVQPKTTKMHCPCDLQVIHTKNEKNYVYERSQIGTTVISAFTNYKQEAINYCSSVQQLVDWTSSTDVFAAYVLHMTQLYSYNINKAFGPFGLYSAYAMYSPLQPSAGVCLDKVRMAMAHIPPNYQPLTVIFTSGRSLNPTFTIQQAQAILYSGAEIFAITETASEIDDELRLSVSSSSYLLAVDSLSSLGKAEIDKIIRRICKIKEGSISRMIPVNFGYDNNIPPLLPQMDDLSTTASTLNATDASMDNTTTASTLNTTDASMDNTTASPLNATDASMDNTTASPLNATDASMDNRTIASTLKVTDASMDNTTTNKSQDSTTSSDLSDNTSQLQNGGGLNNSELENNTTTSTEITTTESTSAETTIPSSTTESFVTLSVNFTSSAEIATQQAINQTPFDETTVSVSTNTSISPFEGATTRNTANETIPDSNTTFNDFSSVSLQSGNTTPLNIIVNSEVQVDSSLSRKDNTKGESSELNALNSRKNQAAPPQSQDSPNKLTSPGETIEHCVDVSKILDPIMRANILRDRKACLDSATNSAPLNTIPSYGTTEQSCIDLNNINSPLVQLDMVMADIKRQPCFHNSQSSTLNPQATSQIVLSDTDIESLNDIVKSTPRSSVCINLNNVFDIYKLGILLSNWPDRNFTHNELSTTSESKLENKYSDEKIKIGNKLGREKMNVYNQHKIESDNKESQIIENVYARYSATNNQNSETLSGSFVSSSKTGMSIEVSTLKTPSILRPKSEGHLKMNERKAFNDICFQITETQHDLRQIVSLFLAPYNVCSIGHGMNTTDSVSPKLAHSRFTHEHTSCSSLRFYEEPILSIYNKLKNPSYVCVDKIPNTDTSVKNIILNVNVRDNISNLSCVDLTNYPSSVKPIILIMSFPIPACHVITFRSSASTSPPPGISGKECIDLSPYSETINEVIKAVLTLKSCRNHSDTAPLTSHQAQTSVYVNSESLPLPLNVRRCVNVSEIPFFLDSLAAKLVSLYPGFICKTETEMIHTSTTEQTLLHPTIIPAPLQETSNSKSKDNKLQMETTTPPCVDISDFSSSEIPVVTEFIKPLMPCSLINKNNEATLSPATLPSNKHTTNLDSNKPCLDLTVFPAFVRPIVRLFPVLNPCPVSHLSKRQANVFPSIPSLSTDVNSKKLSRLIQTKPRRKTSDKSVNLIIEESDRAVCVDISILEVSEIPLAKAYLQLYNITICPHNSSSSTQLKMTATCVNLTLFKGKEKSAITAFFSIYGIPPCSKNPNCLGVSLLPDSLASKYLKMYSPNILCNFTAQTTDTTERANDVTRATDELCQGAIAAGNVSFNPIPGRCHAFVVCSHRNAGGNWTQHDTVPCPPQLFWSQEKLTCVRPEDSECVTEQCSNVTSTVKMASVVFPACTEYLECNNGAITRSCCPEHQVFVEGECIDGINIGCPYSCVNVM